MGSLIGGDSIEISIPIEVAQLNVDGPAANRNLPDRLERRVAVIDVEVQDMTRKVHADRVEVTVAVNIPRRDRQGLLAAECVGADVLHSVDSVDAVTEQHRTRSGVGVRYDYVGEAIAVEVAGRQPVRPTRPPRASPQ